MERKLAAIFAADVHGYSRLMGEDEEATLRTLTAHRRLIDSAIAEHHGRFVNSAGDSVLAEFASAVDAVSCAVEIQIAIKTANADSPPERRMAFRIGVNLGDVMSMGGQIYGDGVNIAARLESLAAPGGICISDSTHAQVKNKLAFAYEDIGSQRVKNIAEPIRVWRVLLDGPATGFDRLHRMAHKYWRQGALSLLGLAMVAATIAMLQHSSFKASQIQETKPLETPVLSLSDTPSIAVLPFINTSGDSQQEYFSDGIADQLINQLSRLPGLVVIARNSSFAYKGKAAKEREVGTDLGVKYVLEGSARKSADHVHIQVELVDTKTGIEKWTTLYDRPLTDIFVVQDEIVDQLVTTLGLLLKVDELKLPHTSDFRTTENVEAFDDLLRAVECYWRLTKDDNACAQRWAQKAIEHDPKFAEAYAVLGITYWSSVWNQWGKDLQADLDHSSRSAHMALALDDANSDALGLMSSVDYLENRFDKAIVDSERAVAINPNYAGGYMALAIGLIGSVRSQEAVRALQKAIRIDPAGQDFYGWFIGSAYNQMGRYREAIPLLERALATYPNVMGARLALIFALVESGRDRDARAQAAKVISISPRYVVPLSFTKDADLDKRFVSALHQAGLR